MNNSAKSFSLLAVVGLLLVLVASVAPITHVSAQDVATPTVTAAPTGSVEEVHQLNSGNYMVIERTFSWGELAVLTSVLVLTGVVLRINDRSKA
jgi:hypothetical protein